MDSKDLFNNNNNETSKECPISPLFECFPECLVDVFADVQGMLSYRDILSYKDTIYSVVSKYIHSTDVEMLLFIRSYSTLAIRKPRTGWSGKIQIWRTGS